MTLGNIYIDALENHYGLAKGWFANWPPNTNVQLGAVGSLPRDQDTGLMTFSPGTTLEDSGIEAEHSELSEPSGDIDLTSGYDTHITFSTELAAPDLPWLKGAKAGFDATFGDTGGLRAQLANIRRQEIKRPSELRDRLLAAANSGNLPLRTAIVTEIQTADVGLIVASESTSAELKVTTDADIAPGNLKLASFAGSFQVKENSGSAVIQPVTAQFTVAFHALVVGQRGIWWWKRFVVNGAAELSADEEVDAVENLLGPSDYLVTY